MFIDTSAYLPRHYSPQSLHYLKTYGQDKVLFGTNFPQLGLEKCVRQVDELELPEDIKAKFLFENARRVFQLTAQLFSLPCGLLSANGLRYADAHGTRIAYCNQP